MADLASLRIIVTGRVQGIYFRDFTLRHAKALGLTGFVRNLAGGRAVEVEAEGERASLEALLSQIRLGPPGARVEEVATTWSKTSGKFSDFHIAN